MSDLSLDTLVSLVQREGFVFPCGRVVIGKYGDSEAMSEWLLGLIHGGSKRATSSLAWVHEAESDPLPIAGDLEIAVDSHGLPSVVLRYTEVEVVPFCSVTDEIAYAEGEGDRTLEDWRQGHWEFFSRECALLGLQPSEEMPVVCQRFEVLHRCGKPQRLA